MATDQTEVVKALDPEVSEMSTHIMPLSLFALGTHRERDNGGIVNGGVGF